MATISLPGLVTGIDTKQLVSQLMAVEQRRLNLYQQRKTDWESKKVAVSDLESKLQMLRSKVKELSDADELRAFKTASSDTDILTAEASNNTFEGNHTVEVNQLATAARVIHSNGIKYAEDYVAEEAGTFIYSYNHNETTITTTDTTTLEELVNLINNDANNPGVTASLLFYNDMYHLVLSGNDAGSDYEITINESNTEVWQSQSPFTVDGEDATLSTKIADLDQFSEIFVDDGYITISGNKHGEGATVSQDFNINENTKLGHLIEEINDAFGGTATATLVNGQIRLTDNTCGTSYMELALTYNAPSDPPTELLDISIGWLTKGGTVSNDLEGFGQLESDFTETQSAQDSQIRVDGYPSGAWISRSSNTVDDVIAGVTLHLHDTGTVQVTLTRDIESVKQKLNSMVSAYNSVASAIKEKTGYNEDSKTAGVLMGDYTVSDIQSQLYTAFISRTSGFVDDIDSFLMPGQIGFEFDKDGVLSLDSTALDEAIAKNYMDVLAVIGAAKTGSSDSNTIEFYSASDKYTIAGTYDVKVIVDGENKSAWIKLSTEPESAYRLATINGNMITGDSTFDDNGNPVYPENGLQLTADLSQDVTATVRVKQGFAGALEDALDKLLKVTTGPIDIDQEQITDNIKNLQDKIDLEQTRLDQKETRLTAKYARLEKTLTLMQNQMAALSFYTT